MTSTEDDRERGVVRSAKMSYLCPHWIVVGDGYWPRPVNGRHEGRSKMDKANIFSTKHEFCPVGSRKSCLRNVTHECSIKLKFYAAG